MKYYVNQAFPGTDTILGVMSVITKYKGRIVDFISCGFPKGNPLFMIVFDDYVSVALFLKECNPEYTDDKVHSEIKPLLSALDA